MPANAETTATPVRSRFPLPRLAFFASLPCALVALLSLSAAWCWIGDVCLHFSWLASAALVPAIFLNWRHLWRIALLMLCLLVGWWPWLRGAQSPIAPATSGVLLAVASANLYDFNTRRSDALDTIVSLPVDLVGVQEVLPADHALLAKHWPFAVWTTERELLASALLSRHPIVWSRVHDVEGFALVDAVVQTPTGRLRVYVAHLASPKSPRQIQVRSRQLERIATLLRSCTEPVVLLGDLNLSCVSPHWQRFASAADLLRPDSALIGTWPSWLGFLGADIDHIAGRQLGIGPLTAFAIPGSDHRGVMATISVR